MLTLIKDTRDLNRDKGSVPLGEVGVKEIHDNF
jgi:hypothetical protein